MARRLLFHAPSLAGGGAERVLVLVANEMAARGHAVTLLAWNGQGPNADLLSPAVELVDLHFPMRGEGFGKAKTLEGLARTVRMLRRLRPEAVFSAPDFANLVMAAALVLARSRARFFPGFHGAAALKSEKIGAILADRLAGFVAARATRAIAVSKGVGRDLVQNGYPPEKIAVIYNPLPPEGVRMPGAHPWRQALAAMGDGPVIGTLGRLVPVKDHATLLRAFAILRAERKARLVIFGEGPLEAETRALADELAIADDVLFAGYVNDPAACYAAIDLLALSSTSEGFGNVLIEAMAHGVPVVSTDAPHGPREILDDGQFGPLVPVADPMAFAVQLQKSLENPIDSATLRQRADAFKINAIADRYEGLLT
ncbi:glycosyltransferase [Shinella sp. HZN7]|jgi:glycosyltransferase involved in cell wall biosynthesis|uniref:glycosyltransferase n=1 Tax=Shinella sp. (strain HZN7) TaxID=879274 RepID=UPI0007DA6124|nr:glycosyltransferase [Shinella sp. HZN7]ANH07364.1 glycosyl transferase [Shinella sp. HZN7]